jgi:hypothetical protein
MGNCCSNEGTQPDRDGEVCQIEDKNISAGNGLCPAQHLEASPFESSTRLNYLDHSLEIEKYIAKIVESNQITSETLTNALKSAEGPFLDDQNRMYYGSTLDQRKSGKGLLIFKNENHVYFGDFLNNQVHGQGSIYYGDGGTYHGGFKENKADGKGKYSGPGGEFYDGDWKSDLRYTFSFSNLDRNGHGVEFFDNGLKYEGNFMNGLKDGHGCFEWKDGSYYTGNFEKG